MAAGIEDLRRQLEALTTEVAVFKDLSAQSSDHSRQLRRAADRLFREFRAIEALIEAALRRGTVRYGDGTEVAYGPPRCAAATEGGGVVRGEEVLVIRVDDGGASVAASHR
jgi:hypothetical protein